MTCSCIGHYRQKIIQEPEAKAENNKCQASEVALAFEDKFELDLLKEKMSKNTYVTGQLGTASVLHNIDSLFLKNLRMIYLH